MPTFELNVELRGSTRTGVRIERSQLPKVGISLHRDVIKIGGMCYSFRDMCDLFISLALRGFLVYLVL